MVSTVRSRPNHYETLGLTPAASKEEILKAFGREMSMFRARPMSAVAQLSIAYETLRNPDKRRAYDASIGLRPEAGNPSIPTPKQDRPRFLGSATAGVAARAAVDPSMRLETAEEALPEGRLGSFIAESLRDPARAEEALPQPKPEPRPQAAPGVETHLADMLGSRHPAANHWRDSGARSSGLKRPALAAGGLLLAVGLAGALLGWRGGTDEAPQRAVPDMAIALPAATPAKDVPARSAPAQEAAPAREAHPRQPAADVRGESIPPPPKVATADELQSGVDQVPEGQAVEQTVEQAVADAPATGPVAAAIPLPNPVIARTISRIGYACGQVASTEAAAGEAEVFKVTCTSGQSFRAAPVRGRYHFRRWDRD
jgi:hypothetical protein